MELSERERLFEATLIELAENGYDGLLLGDVVARYGGSPKDFAAEFDDDKDAYLVAAYESLTRRLVSVATEQCDPRLQWPERIRVGLESLLDELAAQPALARALTRSFPAIRPAAYARYMSFLEEFARFFEEGRKYSGVGEELPGKIEMLAVGAAEAIVFDEIDAGRAAGLPAMMPSILFSLLVPFLGPEEATLAMRNAGGGL